MHYLQEFPLVLFTLLTQLAIGIVLVGQCLLSNNVQDIIHNKIRKQTLVALFALGLATLVSLWHTGSTLNSPFTILNLGTSWLSREIFLLGVTGFALLWLSWLRMKALPSLKEGIVSVIVIIAGLLLTFTMSCIYNQKLMPGWNNIGVFLSFLASTFMLGAFWHTMVLSCKCDTIMTELGKRFVTSTLLWAVLGLVFMAISIPLALPDQSIVVNIKTVLVPYECLVWSHAMHAALSGFAVILMVIAVFCAIRDRGLNPVLTVAAFVFLILGETLGRLIFYLSYTRLGM